MSDATITGRRAGAKHGDVEVTAGEGRLAGAGEQGMIHRHARTLSFPVSGLGIELGGKRVPIGTVEDVTRPR